MAAMVAFSVFCSALIGLGFWDKSRHHKEVEERTKARQKHQQNPGGQQQQLQRRREDAKEAIHA